MKYALALLLAVSPAAFATDSAQVEDGNAITICRGALSAYESGLRSRPLAVVNEGTPSSFVNCGWRGPTNSDGHESFAIVLKNVYGPSRTFNCTAVIGTEDGGATYKTKSVTLASGAVGRVEWNYTADNGGTRWKTNLSAQCLLPTGVGIARTPQSYRQK